MKNPFLAPAGTITNLDLRRRMLRVSAVVVLLCAILTGIQHGVAAGVGIAMLMSTPLLPFSQTVCLGANVLTNLIPDAYAALDVVSRELIGFIPAVARDSRADRAAIGQNLRSTVTPVSAAIDITPAMALPTAAYQTIGNKTFTIQKTRGVPFSWTGSEQRAMDTGPGFLTIQQDQIAQAIRTLINEIEADLADAAYKGASRAYGTAGTTPFATTLGDPAQIRKILDDNGAPSSDRHLIINTTAGAALRTLAQLTKVNEAGDASLLRQGTLLNIHDFSIRESAQVKIPTKGTGASYTSDTTGYAVGATAITLITGTGTILAGDVITFTGDTNKYVVAVALTAGVVTIAAPGLKVALAASAVAVTVGNTATQNCAFSRNALLLGTRLPDLPKEGDIAIDRETITDPRSNLSLELAVYPGFRMNTYMIGLAWGVLAEKNEHIAVLLG
jgi:hypothetical protein